MSAPALSIVTPTLDDLQSLPLLYRRLDATLDDWEWIVVDDCSSDDTSTWAAQLAKRDPRVRSLRLSERSGSHTAIRRGLALARGEAAAFVASDLEDPPEVLPAMRELWQNGAKLVWAVRERTTGLGPRMFYAASQMLPGMPPMPRHGAGFFLADRTVLRSIRERPRNLFAQLAAMDVPQAHVPYERGQRLFGQSHWSLEAKVRFAVDTLREFSLEPAIYRASQEMLAPGGWEVLRPHLTPLLRHDRTHLDVGCGPVSYLWREGLRPVGVDHSIARAHAFGSQSDAAAACATYLPFASGAFDTSWTFGLLHHLNDADARRAAEEIMRVTRPGGHVVIFDGVWPRAPWQSPVATALRAFDRGERIREDAHLRTLLSGLLQWDVIPVRYSWTRLEGLLFIGQR